MEETPELRRWVIAQTETGHPPDALLAQLTARGWPEEQALGIVTRALESRLAELRSKNSASAAAAVDGGLPGADGPPSLHVPQPFGVETPPTVKLLDREIKVLMTVAHPRVILFGGLLSNAECDELVTLSRARMSASQVVDTATGGEVAHEGRTSSGFGFHRGEIGRAHV